MTGLAPRFYKLEFVVKEVEGKKVVNSRLYSILAATDENGSIRAKEQVAVPANVGTGSYTTTQMVDAGAEVDTRRIQPIGNDLALVVSATITAIPSDSNARQAPLFRRYAWNSDVLIPLRKPTIIFSSDPATGNSQFQLEMTATPLP